jgi:hypothetical protein
MARITEGGRSATFEDGTHWPIPSVALADVGWQMRYGDPVKFRMQAAGVIEAYAELIRLPHSERNKRVMVLRAAAQIADAAAKTA